MRIIPSNEYVVLDTLYRRTVRAISDALPEVPKIYTVNERNTRDTPLVQLNSWCESDRPCLPWTAPAALKLLDCYPLGLTIPNNVQENDPHITVTCDHVRNGLLVTEFPVGGNPNADSHSVIRTLVGDGATIRAWDCNCQYASSEVAAVNWVLSLVKGFCEQFARV